MGDIADMILDGTLSEDGEYIGSSNEVNQCQGCQAGWPIEESKLRVQGANKFPVHAVKGGYKGEKVICTKSRYIKQGIIK